MAAEYEIWSSKDTPYPALTNIRCVFRKTFAENWPHYNGTALYFQFKDIFIFLQKSYMQWEQDINITGTYICMIQTSIDLYDTL